MRIATQRRGGLPTAVPPKPRHAYGGITLWGVPYTKADIEYACAQLKECYKNAHPNDYHERLLDNNERVVSRCGMLMSFSGLLIAISLFIATNPKVLPTQWQQNGFYGSIAIWVIATIRLLWSLRHELPPPWEWIGHGDFDLVAHLFLKRLGLYNIALIASVFCFVVNLVLLAPISTRIVDLIFH